jgi:hypothetical protein
MLEIKSPPTTDKVASLVDAARARVDVNDRSRLEQVIQAYVVYAVGVANPPVNPWQRSRMIRRYHTLETALREFVKTGVLR